MQDVCLFAHFDKDNRLDDYVLRYLCEIRELGFATILISTSRLTAADIAPARAFCSDVILRNNAGLDFASWSAGFAKHAADINGRLLLANDSVYGPIGSLKNTLERLTHTAADFYGMVESIENAPHLQSWFLFFEPWVVRDPIFASTLEQPFSSMTKGQIIENGEVGFSRRLTKAGYRYEALYMVSRGSPMARNFPMNPMHLRWRELLFEAGVPFVKIELLRDNPVGVEDRATILRCVAQLDPDIARLIASHLARTAPEAPNQPRRAVLTRYCYALIRRYEAAKREKRHITAAVTRLQLEILAIPLAARRRIKTAAGL